MPGLWTPLLETMGESARVAWPFIQKVAAEGISAEEVIEKIREEGLKTFRRQDMLALIREATNGEILKSDIARWPVDSVLPISRVRESVTKIVAPFSYTLRVRVYDPETDRERIITRQAHSQELRPADAVVQSFLEGAIAREQYERFEMLDAEVVDIQRSGAAGVL